MFTPTPIHTLAWATLYQAYLVYLVYLLYQVASLLGPSRPPQWAWYLLLSQVINLLLNPSHFLTNSAYGMSSPINRHP